MTKEEERGPADAFTGPSPMPRFFSFLGQRPSESISTEGEKAKAAHEVVALLSKHFQVLGSMHDGAGVYVKVILDPKDEGKRFESVRTALKKVRMFPKLVDNGKETVIAVFPLPPRKKGKVTVNLVMLVLTIFTTVWAGAIIWMSRTHEAMSASDLITVLLSPLDVLLGALTFAFPLLLILGTHELGHYFTSRRYGIDATLPYFIPVPPFISPFGTFGALISMKDPISNRKALVDIGAAGPIAGFIVAVPVTLLGLVLTGVFPTESAMVEGETYLMINPPLLFNALSSLTGGSGDSMLFPTALAGWIGLFVTALNLFPVGQLDGGHIARGVLGDKAKYLSYATIAVMIVLGLITGFGTYLLFAVLILFMGGRHPPPLDDVTRLRPRHLMVAGVSVIIMALTFHPVPIETYTHDAVDISMDDLELYQFVSPEHPNLFEIDVLNGGQMDRNVRVELWLNGSRATESLTKGEFDWDQRAFSPFVGLSHSSVSHKGFHILLMGSSRLKAEGKDATSLPLVAGCSREVSLGSSIKVEVKVVSGGEVHAAKEFILARSGLDMDLSPVEMNGTVHELSGTITLLEGPRDPTEVRMGPIPGESAATQIGFIGGPVNGSWEPPFDAGWVFLSPNEDAVMGTINWSLDTITPVALFRMKVDLPEDHRPTRIGISLRMAGRPPYGTTIIIE
ncbi:MAG: site-2 protease family protein [Candidatus Thermoplasmatota archaeon]|jgi:Zn-dependent protease|nr:site-2 protease family protein [Candidatus Thermoplasmatota archaeon]